MENTPFRISRPALGDISNHKLFASGVKTPFQREVEDAEVVYGECYEGEESEIEIYDQDLGRSSTYSPTCGYLENFHIGLEMQDISVSDEEFSTIEQEIKNYLELGVTFDKFV